MKFNKTILYSFLLTLVFTIGAFSQSPVVIKKKCPNLSTYAQVGITAVGDINVEPCAGKTTTFTQNVVLPSGTIIAGGTFKANNGTAGAPSYSFVNSPTTGFYRAAADTIGISTAGLLNATFNAAQDDFRSASFTVNNATASAEFKFSLVPDIAGSGSAVLGDNTGAARTNIVVTNSTGTVNAQAIVVGLGDLNAQANGTALNITDSSGTYDFGKTTATGVFDLDKILTYQLFRTITATGTTGNQTISRPAGTANIAAAGTGVVITNTTVTTSSIVMTTVRTADATCTFVKSAVPTANTITITMNAACNAETSIGFVVWN